MHVRPMTHSSHGYWAIMIAKVMEQYGKDSYAILIQQDISPDSLKKNQARISNCKISKLWQQTQQESEDPYIALKLLHPIIPLAFGTLGMSMMASQHAYDALGRFARFSHYLNDGLEMNLINSHCQVTLSVNTQIDYQHMNGRNIEAIFSSLVTLLQSISAKAIKLETIKFQHSVQYDVKPFEDFFKCPVYFGCAHDQIIFCKSGLYDEHAFSNSDLTGKLDEWMQEGLKSYHPDALYTQVLKILNAKSTLENVTIDQVASQLFLSRRVLQRRLRDERRSYTSILDTCRHNLALKKISDNHISLIQLTLMLGFSDQSNFSRAFKRWTGSTPHQYRNNKV